MQYYWCSKCNTPIEKNTRLQRKQQRGWVCPTCNTGLPRKPIRVIEEEPTPAEVLLRALE